MSCGVIRKLTYNDSTLLEPTEAGKFEAVAITFKMDAKTNDRRMTAMNMSKRKVR